jgi:uncharacterized protein (TIGR02001 family)
MAAARSRHVRRCSKGCHHAAVVATRTISSQRICALRRACRALGPVLLAVLVVPGPARAYVGLHATLQSDERFRGVSLSDGRPVGTFDLSYDDVSGLYASGAATVIFLHDAHPEPFAVKANVGYVARVDRSFSVDLGVLRSDYSHYAAGHDARGYTDLYLGLIGSGIAAHVHYSPDYFGHGVATFYAEIEGTVEPVRHWRLNGHVGLLAQTAGPNYDRDGPRLDWRIGVTRRLGMFELGGALIGGGWYRLYESDREHQGTGALFRVSADF